MPPTPASNAGFQLFIASNPKQDLGLTGPQGQTFQNIGASKTPINSNKTRKKLSNLFGYLRIVLFGFGSNPPMKKIKKSRDVLGAENKKKFPPFAPNPSANEFSVNTNSNA
uniref:Uncharacterized protein n=1 Tax=Romanomermis culicivorax TaxID=13658 RepID=A0A915IGA6_ROMCU